MSRAILGAIVVVVSAAAHRVDGHADVVDCRHHDHRKVRGLGMDSFQQRQPVAVLHHDVRENQLKRLLLNRIQRPEMVPVKRTGDPEAIKAQAAREAQMRKAFSQVGTVAHVATPDPPA